MKISLDWLRDYVDFSDGPERLEELLTGAGFPVEQMARVGDDWMLDVEITSNRPDCLGHVGIAREVATLTGAPLRLPAVDFATAGPPVSERTRVDNEAPALCRRYTARLLDSVRVAPSPGWMQRRLETIGLRAISNVVDVTNYVMMEVGQPLHAFDFARLEEGRIVVRRARPGEQIVTIDHTELELGGDMLVIADGRQPVAVAGIMGGLASEVGPETRTVLLESAHFDPLSVRRTSRALTLGSDSSFRFERNVDIVQSEWASRRAAALLAELAGGTVCPGVIDPGWGPWHAPKLHLRLSRLEALLGIAVPAERVVEILARLGFAPEHDGHDTVVCTGVSWRGDVTREVDLIEEVIRIQGYGSVPTESSICIQVATPDAFQKTRQQVQETLSGCGYFECLNVSFVEDRHLALFAADGFEPVRVKDMARKANNALRHTVLPSLLGARQRNQDAGNGRCDLYELAAVHAPQPNAKLPAETLRLGLLTDGDLRELRGTLETIVRRLDRQATLTPEPAGVSWAAPDAGAELLLNGLRLGQAGVASDGILRGFGLDAPVCLAELDFTPLVDLQGRTARLTPLARFPGIKRDLSLLLDEPVKWRELETCLAEQGIDELERVEFIDIYRGKGVPVGKKSLTLSLHFRREHETLTHETVDGYQARLLATLQQRFEARLRA